MTFTQINKNNLPEIRANYSLFGDYGNGAGVHSTPRFPPRLTLVKMVSLLCGSSPLGNTAVLRAVSWSHMEF